MSVNPISLKILDLSQFLAIISLPLSSHFVLYIGLRLIEWLENCNLISKIFGRDLMARQMSHTDDFETHRSLRNKQNVLLYGHPHAKYGRCLGYEF